jgi:polysaccharide pyruvyl transferase WcaK-like protein
MSSLRRSQCCGRTIRRGIIMKERRREPKKIAFFGHFDSTNFGNESSLQAILYNLRRFRPNAEVLCISTGPDAAAATHRVKAIPVAERFFESWRPRNQVSRILRRVSIGLPTEAYQYVKGLISLRRTDMLIVPGTGLLTDAFGFLGWGPYTLLRWSLIAKLCRCKLLLVSVGAGPIYSDLGRWFIKSILSMADFRSYREHSTLQYLAEIGFRGDNDRVSPDLAFSLPETAIPRRDADHSRRAVVGLGVMGYAGKYSVANTNNKIYLAYLDNLAIFAEWLLAREYTVRLLIGDLVDTAAKNDFKALLRERISSCDERHIIDEPITSVENLLSQIAATDLVVATRFHNVLLSLVCNNPVISIAFHHKCESLMSTMGLSEYCLHINDLKAEQLIERFCDLEKNSDKIKWSIGEKTRRFRAALDQQYEIIFNKMLSP